MRMDYSLVHGELHYHFIDRKIIAEKVIALQPFNYNFYCFNGNPMFIHYGYYDKNEYIMRLLDLEFKKVYYMGTSKFDGPKPKFIDEMVEYAKELSKPFKFVRVDMYYENDRVYLGEMSFSPAAGNANFVSKEKDIEFGSFLDIDPDK